MPIYRFIWQQIYQLEINLTNSDEQNYLLLTLQENMVNYPQYNHQIRDIFNIQENHKPILSNPEPHLKSAIACLEAISLEQYRQYCKQQINELESTNNQEKIKHYFQELLQIETQLKQLALLRMY